MSFDDLFSGNWTWANLVRELLPVVVLAVSAFWAGYAKGWSVGANFVRGDRP